MNAQHKEELDDDQLWTTHDVAQYLRVSRSWIYREVSAGRLPHIRRLNLVRFDPEVIKAFMKSGTVVPGKVLNFPR